MLVNYANGYIEEKSGNKYLIFDAIDENKELLKNIKMFGMESKTKSKKLIIVIVIMEKIIWK